MSLFKDNIEEPMAMTEQHPVEGAPVHAREVAKNRDDIAESTAWARLSNRHYTVILFALICLSLVIVMSMGTNGFRSLVLSKESNTQTRLLSTALATDIRFEDGLASVSRAKGPEGDALVLSERYDGDSFELRFYLSDGWLVKEYASANAAFNPAAADKIAQTDTFAFSFENNLLTFETDEGKNQVYLRSRTAIDDGKGGA